MMKYSVKAAHHVRMTKMFHHDGVIILFHCLIDETTNSQNTQKCIKSTHVIIDTLDDLAEKVNNRACKISSKFVAKELNWYQRRSKFKLLSVEFHQ